MNNTIVPQSSPYLFFLNVMTLIKIDNKFKVKMNRDVMTEVSFTDKFGSNVEQEIYQGLSTGQKVSSGAIQQI